MVFMKDNSTEVDLHYVRLHSIIIGVPRMNKIHILFNFDGWRKMENKIDLDLLVKGIKDFLNENFRTFREDGNG